MHFIEFFCYFFWNFLLRVGLEWNGTIILIFSFSQPFPTYVGLKWCRNSFFSFFCHFFEIFYYASGGNETERQFLFSLFPGLFQPILARNDAIMDFYHFFHFFANFFGIFYYSLHWNGTKRQFLFSPFLGLFKPILSWKEAITGFFNLLNFFAIFF